jgi:signal peptidase I
MTSPAHSFNDPVPHKSAIRLIVEPLAIAIALALLVRATIRIYVIPSFSMAPTLMAGDHIVVTPYRFSSEPQPGDVIVFRSPKTAGELMVKRVIGTPGDIVETREGRVIVHDHALAEPYVATQASTGLIPPQRIPADSYFVLGDNRTDSLDSRSWGLLPRADVLGRARLILWSSETPIGSRESGVVAASSPTPHTQLPTSSRIDRLFKLIQ